ncbi:Lipoprotein signal peptidase [Fructilactobacillus florum 8D]|uniref:Lipoprotein signal peptidase n=1 Tax=Fructilactobacillus florum 8D TaxID=1221538 RepID=W9EEU6_9LACO|nr:signal peptidase II [Fructilactobacillus florum]EKK20972.1 Lipoprotein signal peptidase [Fructilactobacillus florum 2F]ETO40653.1 Lipoprotein signal peptidase [Fructilactobacillus florum 8D]
MDYSKQKLVKYGITLGGSLILLGIDQLLKGFVRQSIPLGTSRSFLPPILSLTNLANTGAAWSFLSGHSWVFTLLAAIALVLFSYFLITNRNNAWLFWGLSLMLTGTVGNLLDRLVNGFVTDMLKLEIFNFPIFNLADCYLTLGVLLIMIGILRGEE